MATEITPLLARGSGLKRYGGTWGECLAEFLGTFVLVGIGDGSVAMTVAALPGSGRTENATTFFLGASDWLIIGWGWAFAVAFGVYVAGGISGGHINPAVTLAFAIRRKFPWYKVGPYIVSQVVGGFVGGALVYAVYHDAIHAFEQASKPPGHNIASFSIFATFPAPYFHGGIWGPLVDQIVGTAFLLLFIAALIDTRNRAPGPGIAPLIIGLTVAAIGMTFGANAGYAINPARDFGPRAFAYLAGWGDLALPGSSAAGGYSWYFWIPIVGPFVGGVVGVVVYDLFVGDVLHARAKRAARAAAQESPSADE